MQTASIQKKVNGLNLTLKCRSADLRLVVT
jgi:hypothetical protein